MNELNTLGYTAISCYYDLQIYLLSMKKYIDARIFISTTKEK